MIARIWTGRVKAADRNAYVQLMEERAVADYRAIEGNEGAWCLHRADGDQAEITMLTFWRDEQAIAKFAGKPVDRARYYDFDQDYLLGFAENVLHYQVSCGVSPVADRAG